jgi:hypothetical protein
MNKTEIEQERARLAGEVFEGAPDWCTYAAMDSDKQWNLYEVKPFTETRDGWVPPHWSLCEDGDLDICKNQPETSLDWTDTLLRRSDYE